MQPEYVQTFKLNPRYDTVKETKFAGNWWPCMKIWEKICFSTSNEIQIKITQKFVLPYFLQESEKRSLTTNFTNLGKKNPLSFSLKWFPFWLSKTW